MKVEFIRAKDIVADALRGQKICSACQDVSNKNSQLYDGSSCSTCQNTGRTKSRVPGILLTVTFFLIILAGAMLVSRDPYSSNGFARTVGMVLLFIGFFGALFSAAENDD